MSGFIARVKPTAALKASLDQTIARTRVLADRVAKASLQANGGFAIPGPNRPAGSPEQGPIDLEAEMASLADEQVHFEASSKLLQKAYESVRLSLRDR